MKSKTEPTSIRIKTLLKVCSACSFNLYYIKGKGLTISDFLSRMIIDKSNPHQNIPISFDLQELLQKKYYFQITSGTDKEEITIGKVNSHDKSLLPHMKQERAAKIIFQIPSGAL